MYTLTISPRAELSGSVIVRHYGWRSWCVLVLCGILVGVLIKNLVQELRARCEVSEELQCGVFIRNWVVRGDELGSPTFTSSYRSITEAISR